MIGILTKTALVHIMQIAGDDFKIINFFKVNEKQAAEIVFSNQRTIHCYLDETIQAWNIVT